MCWGVWVEGFSKRTRGKMARKCSEAPPAFGRTRLHWGAWEREARTGGWRRWDQRSGPG
jgi:hypothetical protein